MPTFRLAEDGGRGKEKTGLQVTINEYSTIVLREEEKTDVESKYWRGKSGLFSCLVQHEAGECYGVTDNLHRRDLDAEDEDRARDQEDILFQVNDG